MSQVMYMGMNHMHLFVVRLRTVAPIQGLQLINRSRYDLIGKLYKRKRLTHLDLDFNIFQNFGSPMERTYAMKGACSLASSSQSLGLSLQEVVILGSKKFWRTNLKFNKRRLGISPSFVEMFLNQVNTL